MGPYGTVRSLRLRAVLVALAVAVAPPLFVLVSNPIESGVKERMEARVRAAADATAAGEPATAVAEREDVWLRAVGTDGAVHALADHDVRAWTTWLSDLVFGDDGAPTAAALDAELHAQGQPLAARAPALAATHTSACHVDGARKLLLCEAAAVGKDGAVVHAAASSRRAIRALYDVRYQVVKLALFVLPLALALGLYLGWRMVRPIELLTARVRAGVPGRLRLDRDDEIGDLSRAFSTLTAALVERSQQNQAFVADLTHEMKNPIAAIRAASEAVDDGSERGARLGRVLGDASRRLDALVTSLLELARAEAGMPGEPRERVDLAALVRAVIDARPDAQRIELDAPAPVPVDGAPARLHSVVANLLDNACAFGGHDVVRVRVAAHGARVFLAVADRGPGLAPQVLPRVFDRFFTTRGERRGTGLGLALVKAIVEAHGGAVDVRSPAGEGAVFTVWLPAVA